MSFIDGDGQHRLFCRICSISFLDSSFKVPRQIELRMPRIYKNNAALVRRG